MYTPPLPAATVSMLYVNVNIRPVRTGPITLLIVGLILCDTTDSPVKLDSETKSDTLTLQVKLAGPPIAADTDDNETTGGGTIINIILYTCSTC